MLRIYMYIPSSSDAAVLMVAATKRAVNVSNCILTRYSLCLKGMRSLQVLLL